MRRPIILLSLGLILCTMTARAGEMRALWVDAWHEGYRTPAQATAMVNKARDCGFNVLFIQVRKRGNVFYKSKIEPISSEIAPDYDPLADIITKAHSAGIQVHAWLVAYQVYPDVDRDSPDAPSRIHVLHPQWLMMDAKGQTRFPDGAMYLDPGLPEVQSHINSIVEEIATSYEIDGIHWDRVIYPRRESGYNKGSVERFNRETGREGVPKPDDQAWCEWRIKQITELVRKTHDTLKRIRPKARVSASLVWDTKEARWDHFQDWPSWLDSGIMDFAVPMVFVKDVKALSVHLPGILGAGKGKPVSIGLGSWQMSADQSVEQIKTVRSTSAMGVAIYSYNGCLKAPDKDSPTVLDALKEGPFATKSALPD